MENNDIIANLKKIKKLPYDLQRNKIEQYSVEILESMATNIYHETLHHGVDKECDILNIILLERIRKLNNDFEWTKNNRETFLKISDKITQVFEKAYNEAIRAAKELENRLLNRDDFIKDYEIKIEISLYMKDEYYKDEVNGSIGYVLSEPISDFYPINYSLGHTHFQRKLSEKPIFLDKTINWNREYLGDTFKNNYIGYAIHSLLGTRQWSFKDIININKVWADVKVIHQYYVENI
jgi:hypothetical protein